MAALAKRTEVPQPLSADMHALLDAWRERHGEALGRR